MGRNSTGAWTTQEARRIDISQLTKEGILKHGDSNLVVWEWKIDNVKTADIGIHAVYNDIEQYVRLIYTITCKDEKINMDYKIQLLERPSNLGVGNVLFFLCPVSWKPCRILYMAYGSHKFKCREAYQNRIYYPMQLTGKLGIENVRYWKLKNQIKELKKGLSTYSYAGKVTRRVARIQRLKKKKKVADWLRWELSTYPCGLRRSMEKNLTNFED